MSSSLTISELLVLRTKWASEGEKVVFTNGVFDILHVGHIHSIESAKSYGTRIVIGINSDSSVRQLGKGPNRPVNNDIDRAKLLSSLTCVDAVVIFCGLLGRHVFLDRLHLSSNKHREFGHLNARVSILFHKACRL